MLVTWEEAIHYLQNYYHFYVDWNSEYFECPFCGDFVYKCDWNYFDACPYCEADFMED